MSQPGWYRDPEGRPGHARYWDGQSWQGPPVPTGQPDSTPEPHKPTPRRGAVWVSLGVGVVAVALLLTWVFVGRGTRPATEDSQSAQPTGSVWNEQTSSSPSPSPTPTTSSPSPSPTESKSGRQIPCPRVGMTTAEQPDPARLTGGGMSFPLPLGGQFYSRVSNLLTDSATYSFAHMGTNWYSFLELGLAPTGQEATDPATMAQQVIECHVTSGSFSGYLSHEILKSESITIDGYEGHWVQVHAQSSETPGGGGIMNAVVMSTGNPNGLAVFWSGAVDADPDLQATFNEIPSQLKIG